MALRLGHRESVDFDFFTEKPLDKREVLNSMPFLKEKPPEQDEKDTLTVITQGVKFSFFGNLSFGRYKDPETTNDRVLDVASPEDLLALKLRVIHDRSERKDYMDIAALLRAGIPLATGLATAAEMFSPNLSPMVTMRALTYFEDGDLHTLEEEDKKVIIKAIQELREPLPKVTLVTDLGVAGHQRLPKLGDMNPTALNGLDV